MTTLAPNFTATAEPADVAKPWPGTLCPLGERAALRLVSGGPGPATALVSGEIDLDCAAALDAALRSILHNCSRGVVVNLAAVSFCDCSGLRALSAARAQARNDDRYFAIGAHSHAASRLLELADARCLLAGTDWTEPSKGGRRGH